MVAEIIAEALPIAKALMKFIELATRASEENLTSEQIEDEIVAIKSWAKTKILDGYVITNRVTI